MSKNENKNETRPYGLRHCSKIVPPKRYEQHFLCRKVSQPNENLLGKESASPQARAEAAPTSDGSNEGATLDESLVKKRRVETPLSRGPFPLEQLRETEDSFLQNGACFEVAPTIPKCLECRLTKNRQSMDSMNVCRFDSFRRLRYNEKGHLTIAGFSDPVRDSTEDERQLWLPCPSTIPADVETSRFLLEQIGDQFCKVVQEEKAALNIHMSEDKSIAWKRVVKGVREMCDLCETSIFNVHWVCGNCGMVVCMKCYQKTESGLIKFRYCANHVPHKGKELVITQVIPGDSLLALGHLVHELRTKWKIPQNCGCPEVVKGAAHDMESLLTSSKEKYCEVLSQTSSKTSQKDSLDNIVLGMVHDSVERKPAEVEFKHFVRRYERRVRDSLPIRIMYLGVSERLYPNVPHKWLCEGRLLQLINPSHPYNMKLFQDQWKRGQPVIISHVTQHLNKSLWLPKIFSRDFGDEKNDFVNCVTGKVVPQQPMCKFWEGFEDTSKRLKDVSGVPLVLKLKDWPPGEDFAKILPLQFEDLMQALPLHEYTHRSGKLNLAGYLPECFVRPDLGPKMYSAYGSAMYPGKGTTNLHLDMSDAVNVMVYIGIPKDKDNDKDIEDIHRALDVEGYDSLTRRRIFNFGEIPGALWHIYDAHDADKIRDLLNKVSMELGLNLEKNHDPIHTQTWYLNKVLRNRLYEEYGVQGYTIVQCDGDSVFIPAGAPHQVWNLRDCVKIAEDFVSPEHVSQCMNLTQEFRELPEHHTNHEDKLQIKSMMYSTVRNAVAVLANMPSDGVKR